MPDHSTGRCYHTQRNFPLLTRPVGDLDTRIRSSAIASGYKLRHPASMSSLLLESVFSVTVLLRPLYSRITRSARQSTNVVVHRKLRATVLYEENSEPPPSSMAMHLGLQISILTYKSAFATETHRCRTQPAQRDPPYAREIVFSRFFRFLYCFGRRCLI